MIEIKNLVKQYKTGNEENLVVNNINLEIKQGEFIAIVGQSGSGKTQLIQLIGGLEKPTSGEIIVDGVDISKLKDKAISNYRKNTVAFIFQDFILEETQSVINNVMMPMIFAGVPVNERKEKALDALDKVGLKDMAKRKANQLSGGQRQRVAIARALVNNPKIILADEPTGNLDSKTGSNIMELLTELNNKGYTLIMVTHNTEQSFHADRIIKIKDGSISDILDTNKDDSIIAKKKINNVKQILENEDVITMLGDDKISSIKDLLNEGMGVTK